MKQNIKRLWLMVCMVFCLFALSACSAAEDSGQALDAELSEGLCSVTEGILELCTELSAEELEEAEASALKQKDNVTAGLFTAWKGVRDEAGDFVEILSSQAVITEDGDYECVVTANFAQRKVEFKAFYEDGAQGMPVPTSFSFTPEYTVGEKLAKAGMNTAMGMGTVFLVLIFISLIISCFKFINAFENKTKAPAPAVVAAPAPVPAAVQEEELVDDLELVAVITAAIAAFDNTSADSLVVRSIKRAPGAKWKRA
ncbi:MAG: OadG family protein [Lachnospiraceae bacterium]|nr:OadG family protein [Lachnospiraceae bacterium]